MSYDDDRDVATNPDAGYRGRWLPGVAALALFVVLAVVFVGAPFPDAASGFQGEAGITSSIGYAMFNIDAPDAVASEGLLVAFEIIDVVLVAALVGGVMLASRETEGELTTALRSDAVEQESSPQEVVADGGEVDD